MRVKLLSIIIFICAYLNCSADWESVRFPSALNQFNVATSDDLLDICVTGNVYVQASNSEVFLGKANATELLKVTPKSIDEKFEIMHVGVDKQNIVIITKKIGQYYDYPLDPLINIPDSIKIFISRDEGKTWSNVAHPFASIYEANIINEHIVVIGTELRNNFTEQLSYSYDLNTTNWHQSQLQLSSLGNTTYSLTKNSSSPFLSINADRGGQRSYIHTLNGIDYQEFDKTGLESVTAHNLPKTTLNGTTNKYFTIAQDGFDRKLYEYDRKSSQPTWTEVTWSATNPSNELPASFEPITIFATSNIAILKLINETPNVDSMEIYYTIDHGVTWIKTPLFEQLRVSPFSFIINVNTIGDQTVFAYETGGRSHYDITRSEKQGYQLAVLNHSNGLSIIPQNSEVNSFPHQLKVIDDRLYVTSESSGVAMKTGSNQEWMFLSSDESELFSNQIDPNNFYIESSSSSDLILHKFDYYIEPTSQNAKVGLLTAYQVSSNSWTTVGLEHISEIKGSFRDQIYILSFYAENQAEYLKSSYPFNEFENAEQDLPGGYIYRINDFNGEYGYCFVDSHNTHLLKYFRTTNGADWAGKDLPFTKLADIVGHPWYLLEDEKTVYNVETDEKFELDYQNDLGFYRHVNNSKEHLKIKYANNRFHAFRLMGNNSYFGAAYYTSTDGEEWQLMDFNLPSNIQVEDIVYFDGDYYLTSKHRGVFVHKGEPLISSVKTVGKVFQNLKIYPNPTQGIATIESNEATAVSIFKVNGQIISEIQVENKQIDLSDLNNGFYYLQIKNKQGETISTNPIIKE